jgi:uncharacterized protein YhbP (UPF0306 family)
MTDIPLRDHMPNSQTPIFGPEFDQVTVHASDDPGLAEKIRQLVSQQSFGILCTQGDGQPYGSLIAYAFSDDLKSYFFTTPIATRKYQLLSSCNRVALVVDNRCHHPNDTKQIEAITATGKATRLESGTDYDRGMMLLKNKHAYFNSFLDASYTALFRVNIVRYFYVTHLQNVSQWIP